MPPLLAIRVSLIANRGPRITVCGSLIAIQQCRIWETCVGNSFVCERFIIDDSNLFGNQFSISGIYDDIGYFRSVRIAPPIVAHD